MNVKQTRILKELGQLRNAALDGIKINMQDASIDTIIAEVEGPKGSKFETTISTLEVKLSNAYFAVVTQQFLTFLVSLLSLQVCVLSLPYDIPMLMKFLAEFVWIC